MQENAIIPKLIPIKINKFLKILFTNYIVLKKGDFSMAKNNCTKLFQKSITIKICQIKIYSNLLTTYP